MPSMPVRIDGTGRRFGPVYRERIYGSPLEPWVERRTEVPAHQSWFVGGEGGEVGALWIAGALHLAVGRGGSGWVVDAGAPAPLSFSGEVPPALSPEPANLDSNLHRGLAARRAHLAKLSYCSVEVAPGRRFFLTSGLMVPPGSLAGSPERGELIETVSKGQPAAPRAFFSRLIGSAAAEPAGALLVLDCERGEDEPEGFLPWLAYHERHGVTFDWMGNEGGGGLLVHSERAPAAEGGTVSALLDLLGASPEVRAGLGDEAWDEWRDYGEDDPAYAPLIAASPERGFWREVELEELRDDLRGGASEYLAAGTADARLFTERRVPGSHLVDRLRASLHEPAVVALHQVPSDESVVVWFALGGVSKSSGDLEVMLVERVWS